MKNIYSVIILSYCLYACSGSKSQKTDGWVSLFDGKSFNGWKVGNNASSFSIENGMIVANGPGCTFVSM